MSATNPRFWSNLEKEQALIEIETLLRPVDAPGSGRLVLMKVIEAEYARIRDLELEESCTTLESLAHRHFLRGQRTMLEQIASNSCFGMKDKVLEAMKPEASENA
jgi:hypothetical protein